MKEAAICKRIIFHNLVLKGKGVYLLVNLFSFRRTILEENDLRQLYETKRKLASGGTVDHMQDKVYFQMLSQKQILDEALIFRMDELHEKNTSQTLGPITNIMLQLSNKCNLNCVYCYQKQYSDKSGRISKVDIPKIIKFISQYKENNNKELEDIIISGGEPLLKENIAIINTIFKEFGNCKFQLFTNGINVLKFADKVDFKKFCKVQVSLDGQDAVISKISQMSSICVYEQILEGTKYLSTCGCEVEIACIISHGITEWLETFLQDLDSRNIFGELVHMSLALPTAYSKNEAVDKSFATMDEYMDVKKIVVDKGYSKYVTVNTPFGFSRIKAKVVRKINSRVEGSVKICKSNEHISLVFGPNGKVYWCSCQEPRNAIVGDYRSGEIYYDLLEQFGRRNIFTIPQCRECDMRYVCSSGCPNLLTATGKNVLSPACGELDDLDFVDRLEDFIL